MMARTSRLRTSKETSCRALTPPNASDTPSTDRIPSPMRRACASRWTCGALIASRGFPRCGRRYGVRVGDLEVGGERPVAPVLVFNLRLDVPRLPAGIEGLDQRRVLLCDEAPPHLAGASELLVVGVELLVQEQEAMDLRIGDLRLAGEVGVHLFHAFAHQLIDLVARGEIGVPGVRQAAVLRPGADRRHVAAVGGP